MKPFLVASLLVLGVGISACGSPTGAADAGHQCTNTCPSLGVTQCSGTQVETCMPSSDGCFAWTAAVDCVSGFKCNADTNKCDDVCNLSDLKSSCQAAYVQLVHCCASGGAPQGDGVDFCHAILEQGDDPVTTCAEYATASCGTLHDAYTAATSCCCPNGQYCDPDHGNACVPTCRNSADCSGSSNGTACAPVVVGNAPTAKRFICKPNDGANWHGCNGSTTCTGDCWGNPATGDYYCLPSCNSDNTCGNADVACCNSNLVCSNALQSCSTTPPTSTGSASGNSGGGCLFCQ